MMLGAWTTVLSQVVCTVLVLLLLQLWVSPGLEQPLVRIEVWFREMQPLYECCAMVASKISKHEREKVVLGIVFGFSTLALRCLDIEPRPLPGGVHLTPWINKVYGPTGIKQHHLAVGVSVDCHVMLTESM
jgi:hypothetical protein